MFNLFATRSKARQRIIVNNFFIHQHEKRKTKDYATKIIKDLKEQGQGNQCQTPGVKFEE